LSFSDSAEADASHVISQKKGSLSQWLPLGKLSAVAEGLCCGSRGWPIAARFTKSELRNPGHKARDQLLEGFPAFWVCLPLSSMRCSLTNALDACLSGYRILTALLPIRSRTSARSSWCRSARWVRTDGVSADIPEVQGILSLIAQFERTGGHEFFTAALQVPVCRSLYRKSRPKRGRATRGFSCFPMFLSLLGIWLSPVCLLHSRSGHKAHCVRKERRQQ
jgi:hypothetical protein